MAGDPIDFHALGQTGRLIGLVNMVHDPSRLHLRNIAVQHYSGRNERTRPEVRLSTKKINCSAVYEYVSSTESDETFVASHVEHLMPLLPVRLFSAASL